MNTNEAKSVFFDLLAIPEDQHSMYIDRVCGENEPLKRRVQSLINAHLGAGGFLGDVGRELESAGSSEINTPELIGSYRVIRTLGQGGFGTVYLCQQERPIERRIAVKVLRPGMDSRSVLRRFEEERILLSRMDHPGIARVLDAGKTEDGQPYIAMEYIEGVQITTYCNNKQLVLRSRLSLFAQACQAIQHAHQKGVIHRDIKPSNVLVTEVDGRAVVKVIDFGVSKAFEDQISDDTITRTMQLVGTPQYMSPEQASVDSSDVDTRTDVYSLGVMLYELSTGLPPFDPQRLRSVSVGQLERMIRDIDPQRPSVRVAKLDKSHADRISSQRSESIGHIVRELKGEIDWVITKTMEKDRDRRYSTVNALFEDVERVLRGDVVRARPPSSVYAARKFVSRHRAGTLVASLVFVSLVVITGLSLGYAQTINRANDQISSTLHNQEQVLAFTEEMLGGIDPAVARGKDTELFRTILDSAGDRVNIELADSPEVEVRVRVLIGKLYLSIGMLDEALAQFKSASAIGSETIGDRHVLTIGAYSALGTAYAELSQYAQARGVFEEALEKARAVFGEDHPDTLVILSDLAAVYNFLGDHNQAIAAGESLLSKRLSVLGDDHDDTMATRNSLALALKGKHDYSRAVDLFERVLEHQLIHLEADHPNTLKTRSNLALVYQELGEFDKSIEMNTEILEQKQRVLGDQHPSVIVSMVNLGTSLEKVGDDEKALALLENALEISLGSLGQTHQYTLIIYNNLANHHGRNNEFEMAREFAQLASDGFEQSLGSQHPMTLRGKGNLADILLDMGRAEEALQITAGSETIASEIFETTDRRLGMHSERLAKCFLMLGQNAEAREHYQRAVQIYASSHGDDSEQYLRVREALDELNREPVID